MSPQIKLEYCDISNSKRRTGREDDEISLSIWLQLYTYQLFLHAEWQSTRVDTLRKLTSYSPTYLNQPPIFFSVCIQYWTTESCVGERMNYVFKVC